MEPVHHPSKIKKTDVNIKKNTTNEIYSENYPVDENATLNLEKIRSIICQSSAKNNKLLRSDIKKWQPVLVQLLHSLCRSEDIGDEITLLTSHAFLSLLRVLYTSQDFENSLKRYFDLQTKHLIDLGKTFDIYNLNLFKLLISNGFLQLGNNTKYSYEVYKTIFKIIHPRCIRYTQYTYFAFKILQTWMKRTSEIGLWGENSLELEEKLEAIIFSNWDNMICKANVTGVFAAYLVVMKNKYEDFLPYLFYNCVERISWCHVTKYVLLSEICNALDNIELMTESKFISNLFNSLTIDYLCSASTKVYTIIYNKISKETWKSTFGIHLKNYVITWETEKKYHALQVLCKCWIEPIIKTHRDILPFLLECCDEGSILYQTHLLRIANKHGITPFLLKHLNNVILLDHEEEFIRLNVFAAHCYGTGNFNDDQYIYSVNAIKRFLYSNATADSTYLREGILNYFKIFFSNILKRAFVGKDPKKVIFFLDWLYEFQMDCFEIGSCYQRKIFGLHLYKISLQFLYSNSCTDSILSKDPTFKEAIKYAPLLQHEMRENNKWKFTDKQSVVSLFKLVLDPASDIRENSASIILDFFHSEVLSNSEKMSLFVIALSKCNSCKFFEIESGAYLLKILTKWFPLTEVKKMDFNLSIDLKINSSMDNFQSYTEFMLEEATQQLALVKRDIFKASTQHTPFYGVVTALVVIGFNNGPGFNFITEKLLEKIIDLAEDAVQYFLQAFSVKSSDSEHSSSFEEMGLAIDQAIKSSEVDYEFDELVLSPAQQLIIMTIWRSLKVLCDLAVEIAKNRYATDSIILRASEIIFTVSIKCRHKGVIESAGVAIANLTRYLCKNQKNVEIPEGILKKLLDNNFSTNINLTRKGAGLTIMFHKIIVSDIRNNRPLLHFAVNSLLQSLGETFPINFEQEHNGNHDNPLAMYLHFFKTLVADKQLQPQLSPYLERICLICFEYMPSQVFSIRNASFQLFGAIVSRLVGQNTGAKNVDFGYGYSINYFATHFPQLAAHVLLSLQACCQTLGENSHWQNSSNVIHILSLLSKMFFSDCELIDGTSRTYVKQIKSCLYFFLSSPIDYVRNLSAKAFSALTGSRSIEKEICELKLQISMTTNLNRLNGYLYILEYLYEKKDYEIQSTTIKHRKIKSLSEVRKNLEFRLETELLWNFWSRRCLLIQQKQLCYVVESQLLRLSRKFKLAIEENYANETKKKINFATFFEKMKPGFFDFVEELMILLVNYLSYNEDNVMINTMLGAECIDFGINFLKYAPRQNRSLLMMTIDFANNNFEKSHQILLEEINIYAVESIKNIFRGKLMELQYVDISKLKTFASKLGSKFTQTIQLSELLTFVHVLSLRGSGTYDLFEDVISCISKERVSLANYFSYSELLRQLIAGGLEILLCNFDRLSWKCRLTAFLGTLILLKDEVVSIRQTIRESVLNNVILEYKLSNQRTTDEIIYSTLLLNIVSESTVLGKLSYNETVEFFNEYFSTFKQPSANFGIETPFDDDNITPYNEETKLINLIAFCMQQKLCKGDITKDQGIYGNISCSMFDIKHNMIKKMNIDLNNLEVNLNIKYDEYVSRKLRIMGEELLKK